VAVTSSKMKESSSESDNNIIENANDKDNDGISMYHKLRLDASSFKKSTDQFSTLADNPVFSVSKKFTDTNIHIDDVCRGKIENNADVSCVNSNEENSTKKIDPHRVPDNFEESRSRETRENDEAAEFQSKVVN
jgi:hypothetical protein